MTTQEELAETALAFCRETLGWPFAVIVVDEDKREFINDGMGGTLDFRDLNAVMEETRGWCESSMLWIQLTCAPGEEYVVHILKRREEALGYHCHADPCHALMSAALEASRKLRGRK